VVGGSTGGGNDVRMKLKGNAANPPPVGKRFWLAV
jgi:hypothetical protein